MIPILLIFHCDGGPQRVMNPYAHNFLSHVPSQKNPCNIEQMRAKHYLKNGVNPYAKM